MSFQVRIRSGVIREANRRISSASVKLLRLTVILSALLAFVGVDSQLVTAKEVTAQTTESTTQANVQSDEAATPTFTQGFFKGYMKTLQAPVAADVPSLFANGQFAKQSLETAAKIFEGVAFTAASKWKLGDDIANAPLAGEIEGGAHQASGYLTQIKLENCPLDTDKLDLYPGMGPVNASKAHAINEATIMAVILREADACFRPGSAIAPTTAVPGISNVVLRALAGPINGIVESKNGKKMIQANQNAAKEHQNTAISNKMAGMVVDAALKLQYVLPATAPTSGDTLQPKSKESEKP